MLVMPCPAREHRARTSRKAVAAIDLHPDELPDSLSGLPLSGDRGIQFAVKKEIPVPMLTDAPPRNSNLGSFQESDRINTLDLPSDSCLP
jgi:hypothetical protein